MKTITLLLGLFFHVGVFAQTPSDSLQKIWSNPYSNDSIRIDKYINFIGQHYTKTDQDTAIKLLTEVRDYCEDNDYLKGEAIALRSIGTAYYTKGDYPSALNNFWQALDLFKKVDDTLGIGKTLGNVGLMFQNQGLYPKAIRYYDSSLVLFTLLKDDRSLSKVYTNLGNVHMRLGNYEQSAEYQHKSLELDIKTGNKRGQASSYGNLGLLHLFQEEYDTAYALFEKCMKLFQEVGDLRSVAGSYSNFAKVYQRKGQYEKSLEYFMLSLKKYEEINDTRGIIFANFDMYPVLNKLNRHEEAIQRCQKIKKMAEEVESVSRIRDACICLYNTHKELGQSDEALRNYEEMNRLEDSMGLHAGDKKIQALEYEQAMYKDSIEQVAYLQKKELEHQAALRSETLTRNIALGSGILLVFLTWGVYNRYRRVQTQKKLSDEQVDRLLKEEELKVMDALMEGRDTERKRISADLHDELGSKVSALRYTWASIFENRPKEEKDSRKYEAMDQLVDQLSGHVREFVRRQSDANVANFGIKNSLEELRELIQASHKIELNSFIQESIHVQKQTELELYKIILELVSNALKYAEASYINIHLSHQENELVMIVEDDGRGFERERVQRGMGLKNIQLRAQRIGGELQIDTTPGRGTTVILKAVA